MWPFRKKQAKPGKVDSPGVLINPGMSASPPIVNSSPTPCSLACTCSFSEQFRFKNLPELVGKTIKLTSSSSAPDDVRNELGLPFKVGRFLDWVESGGLPGYAGELWKLRRAELTFEIDDLVECEIAGAEVIGLLGLDLDDIWTHEEFRREIDQHGDRLLLKLMLKDPDTVPWQITRGGSCSAGEALLLVSKLEEARYKNALNEYCKRYSLELENLLFADGVKCFLEEYLPREMIVYDACVTNLSHAIGYKHFAL